MKKIVAILLAVLMLVMCTACGGKETTGDNNNAVEEVYDASKVYDLPEAAAADSENPIIYFSMSKGDYATGESKYMTASLNEVSVTDFDFSGEERKVGKFSAEALDFITVEFEKTALASLNGQSVYEEGDAYCSLYIQYADGTMISADFSGSIPEDYTNGYAAMEKAFGVLADALPKYVAQPSVAGEVNETEYNEMLSVLLASGIEGLDAFMISNIDKTDAEIFCYTAGLTSAEGIASGTVCQPMMMTTPYSLVIVTVEDAANIEAVRNDFTNSIDWMKWVCVAPTNALVAQKGNMVLCLMASDTLYNGTADALGAAGWSETVEFANPNL